jgi:hypothetical protein
MGISSRTATMRRLNLEVIAAATTAARLTTMRPIRTRGDLMTRDMNDYASPNG